MIISRVPLRASFFGGGSDMPDFYKNECGCVLSTTIKRYVYVTVNRRFDSGIRVAYSKTEEVDTVSRVEHRLVRAVLTELGISGGVEITTVADIPGRGSGLGSSSSFTVGLLQSLYAFLEKHKSQEVLAEAACNIEINICGEPIGKQDQFAAACGGFNVFEFQSDGTVLRRPVVCKATVCDLLQSRLLMFYTGITRSASEVLAKQRSGMVNDQRKRAAVRRMVEIAYEQIRQIELGSIESFGAALHESWALKRNLADGISNLQIDSWYKAALEAGAEGGKILGAGAGGFLLFYARPEFHEAIVKSLSDLRFVPIMFEPRGAQIVYHS